MSNTGTQEGAASPFWGSCLWAGAWVAFLEEDEGGGSSVWKLRRPFGISRDTVRQQDSVCRRHLQAEAGARGGAQSPEAWGAGAGGKGAAARRGPAVPGTPGGRDSGASSVAAPRERPCSPISRRRGTRPPPDKAGPSTPGFGDPGQVTYPSASGDTVLSASWWGVYGFFMRRCPVSDRHTVGLHKWHRLPG